MHSFLRAIGFSKLNNRIQVEALIHKVVEQATNKCKYSFEDNTAVAELSFEFAEGIGLTVRGEYDENDQFHAEHYYPYFHGQNVSTREEVYISKRVDTDAYTGMCDDYRLGVSLIFYLQNAIDYLSIKAKTDSMGLRSITLAGLAQEGKILLPVEKTERQIDSNKADLKYRNQLIAEAKRGNQEAIDSLTIDDIDMYAMVSKRIKKEDIYSIVETSFIPYGSESDNYTVLGTIIEWREVSNEETKEMLYLMQLECNGLTFEVCINKEDLFGEPQVGRRFRGTIWMQGMVDFIA